MFIFGKTAKAGFTGEHPSLENLVDGDLRFHTDFRSVYSTVPEDWLVVDSKNILGKQFQKAAFKF